MSDPAVEAARRAWARPDKEPPPFLWNQSVGAAREAIRPVRAVVEDWRQTFADHGDESAIAIALAFMNALAPLIYTSEELES